MSLDFDSIVYIANQLKQEKSGKGLPDSEIMALHCIWFRLSYSDFVQNQKILVSNYSHLYANPNRYKRESTLAPCAHRVLEIFREKYSLSQIKKNQFRKKILELYNSPESLVYKDFTRILKDYIKIELTENETTLELNITTDDSIIENDINYENFGDNLGKDEKYFIGRREDLDKFICILEDKSVVLLSGFHGIGKTYFLRKTISFIEDKYECFYTDFGSVSTFEEWAIKILSWSNVEYQLESLSLMKSFLDLLESNKILLIIDSVGKFDNKFNSFIESFVINDSMKSKLVISSSHKVKLNIPEKYIARYELLGLRTKKDIFEYLSSLDLKDEDFWEELSDKYTGNFRELKYVSKFIRDFFNGSVSEYLKVNTNIISSDLYSAFSRVNFEEIDYKIFAAFSKDKNGLSRNILALLRGEARSAEIFLRIQFLCDQGYLTSSRDEKNDFVYYSIFPLLRNYLIQEKLIDA